MRDNVRAFVRLAAEAFDLGGPVYEFGSYLVDDQADRADLRPLFPGRQYVGCDMRPGPGVDRVEDLGGLKLADATARTVLCVDTLEHVFEARRAADEMIRVLAPGGALLITAPMDFRIHDYPGDYWRLTPSCIQRLLSPLPATIVGWQGVESYPHTVFGIGFKGPVSANVIRQAGQFVDAFQAWLDVTADSIPWPKKLRSWMTHLFVSKGDRRRQREQHRAHFALDLPANRDWNGSPLETTASSKRSGARMDQS
jgi:SAM-dependent methyltransferase